jgi:hypothetical protein
LSRVSSRDYPRVVEQQSRRRGRRGKPRCAFCGRALGEVSYLHAETEWACICNGCIYDAKAFREKGPGKARRCTFCGSDRDERDWIFGGNMIAICDRCVDRCVEEIAAG